MAASSDSSTGAAPPRRWPPARALLLLVVLLVGALLSLAGLAYLRERFVVETFHLPDTPAIPVVRVRLRDRPSYPVQFLLLHGYVANRGQLLHLAEVLAAAGADVFVLDFPGRGDHSGAASPLPPEGPRARLPTPRETQAALAVVRHLEHEFGVRPERLILVGHSMGGGVALELARSVGAAATVLLAGLERPVRPEQPRNLLLITARFEFPPLRRAADRMYARARGGAVARREFLALHSSLPYHSAVQRAIVEWANQAIPGAGLRLPPQFNQWLLALEWAGVLFLGALLLPLSQLAAWALAQEPLGEVVAETRMTLWTGWHLGGYALLSAGAVVSALALLQWLGGQPPLAFLRLADGDYLASVFLLATVWFLPALRRPPWVRSWRETAAKTGAALGLVIYLVVVIGGFATWQLFDLWPTAGRILRFLVLALALLPFAFGEELMIRTYAHPQREERARSGFLLWRLSLLAAIAYGAALLETGRGMLVLMTLPLVLLLLMEHFFAACLRRALDSVYAVAVFKAVLLGWLMATIFPLR